MDMSLIAENIKYHRKRLNLSQFQLAELANVNEKTITRAEGGKTLIKNNILAKIANALNIPIYKLFLPIVSQNSVNEEILSAINAKIETMNKKQLKALYKIVCAVDEM